jgi:bisanhydrobacterioruberin hydratase
MEGQNFRSMKTIVGLTLLYMLGIFGYFQFPVDSAVISFAGGLSLLMVTAILLIPEYLNKNIGLLKWFSIVCIFGFGIEVVGVHTGLIFGSYEYGSGLGVTLLGVPLVIGLNWGIVVLGSLSLARMVTRKPLMLSTTSAGLAVFLDLVLEAVAGKMDYWHWGEGVVPFQNYIAWYVIAFIMSYFFTKRAVVSDFWQVYQSNYILQYLFFIVLLVLI